MLTPWVPAKTCDVHLPQAHWYNPTDVSFSSLLTSFKGTVQDITLLTKVICHNSDFQYAILLLDYNKHYKVAVSPISPNK